MSLKFRIADACTLGSASLSYLQSEGVIIPDNVVIGRNDMLCRPICLDDQAIFIHSKMGSYSYLGKEAHVINSTIGRYCTIGDRAEIGLGYHNYKSASSSQSFYHNRHYMAYSGTINHYPKWFAQRGYRETSTAIIGHDVYLGAYVKTPGDITIGHGAIVEVGAVLTKDIPPYAIVNAQAKITGYRYTDEIISDLLELKWWDFDLPKAISSGIKVPTDDITEFIELIRAARAGQIPELINNKTNENQPSATLPLLDSQWYLLLVKTADEVTLVPVPEDFDQEIEVFNVKDE